MPVISDEEFLRVELENGVSAENPAYVGLMKATVDYLALSIFPRSILEIGSGVGVFVSEALKQFIPCDGIEPSIPHQQYAKNKIGTELISIQDAFTKLPNHYDLIVSIEVFEHLTDEQIVEYLDTFKSNYFLLTSTPYATTREQDEAWGHINIKQPHEWEEIFAMYGYKVKDRPRIPTEWAILFEHV